MKRARMTWIAAFAALALGVPAGAGTAFDNAAAAPLLPVSTNVGCDPIDPAACLLPFPNDFFTTPDPKTATRKRINLLPTVMPRTGAEVTEGGEGKPADPTEWNRNDGWSPGSMVMAYVPGIDLHQTWGTTDRAFSEAGINQQGYFDHRDHIADIGLIEEPDAPIVIIDAVTGERHPFWSELDQHRGAVEAGEQVLIMRPAVNFKEGHRYIVAMRNLKDASGNIIARGAAFDAFVNGTGEAARQAHFNNHIFPQARSRGDREG
jgi:hypothetical protein